MKNFVEEGNVLNITAPSGGLTGGQPFCLGDIPLVATSTVAEGELTAAGKRGVFRLQVHGHDGTENAAIKAGGQIYYVSGETPVLNANVSGVPFGKTITAVASGATVTNEVLIDE